MSFVGIEIGVQPNGDFQKYIECTINMENAGKNLFGRTMMNDKLVIRSINEMVDDTWEALYWSNQWGWTGIEEADAFTEEEAGKLNLPVGGEWVYQSSEGVEDANIG